MKNQIFKLRTAMMLLLGLALLSPGVFAQVVHDNDFRRGVAQGRGNGHGNRHYYHHGNWNRNGWYGWGAPSPVWADGVLVSSLPPGYTAVIVGGNSYYYGNDMYFRQVPSGGYAVVTLP